MRILFSFLAAFCLLPQIALADDIRTALTPVQSAKLAAPMSGQIIALHAQDGAWVKKGQVLVRFQCAEEQARLSQTKARVARHKSLYDAAKEMLELKAIGAVELNVKKADYEEAKAERALAQANLNKCSIKAPFSGRIGQLDVTSYDIVQQGQPLLDILNDKTLQAEMIVPSKWLSFLKKDFAFKLYIDETGQTYDSHITRIGGRVDPVTQSVKAYAQIDNDDLNLLAGMSGTAHIQDPSQKTDISKETRPDDRTEAENPAQHP